MISWDGCPDADASYSATDEDSFEESFSSGLHRDQQCFIADRPSAGKTYVFSSSNMDFTEKVSIPKFSGLTSEDPSKFLDSFRSYSLLYNLDKEEADARKVAAFHLKLTGPALIWFQSLQPPDGETKAWPFVERQFLAKYVDLTDNPALLAEAELFDQLTLSPSQPLEEYHSILVEKGLRLGKPAKDLLQKFVAGLPQQLGFYVRARGPPDHQTALTEALIGEAHGYRLKVSEEPRVSTLTPSTRTEVGAMPMVPGAAQVPSNQSTVADLQTQVRQLTKQIRQLQTSHSQPTRRTDIHQQEPRQQHRQRQTPHRNSSACFNCSAPGHNQRACNLQEGTRPRPDFTCSVCGQQGHGSARCKLRDESTGQASWPIQQRRQQQPPLNDQSQAVGSRRLGNRPRY